RHQVHDHLEARLARHEVDAGDVGGEAELQVGTIAQRAADLDEMLAGDVNRGRAVERGRDFDGAVRGNPPQRLDDMLAIHSRSAAWARATTRSTARRASADRSCAAA